jgi:hypothetical protein
LTEPAGASGPAQTAPTPAPSATIGQAAGSQAASPLAETGRKRQG